MDSNDSGVLLVLLVFSGIWLFVLSILIWFRCHYLPSGRNGSVDNIPESAVNGNNAVFYVRKGASEISESNEDQRTEVIICKTIQPHVK